MIKASEIFDVPVEDAFDVSQTTYTDVIETNPLQDVGYTSYSHLPWLDVGFIDRFFHSTIQLVEYSDECASYFAHTYVRLRALIEELKLLELLGPESPKVERCKRTIQEVTSCFYNHIFIHGDKHHRGDGDCSYAEDAVKRRTSDSVKARSALIDEAGLNQLQKTLAYLFLLEQILKEESSER